MDRDELIALVRRIMAAEGETEEGADRLVELFEANVPHPDASNFIFWPEHAIGERRELSAEEIVDMALSYRPISLGPGSSSAKPS
jgi:hypothetical protein